MVKLSSLQSFFLGAFVCSLFNSFVVNVFYVYEDLEYYYDRDLREVSAASRSEYKGNIDTIDIDSAENVILNEKGFNYNDKGSKQEHDNEEEKGELYDYIHHTKTTNTISTMDNQMNKNKEKEDDELNEKQEERHPTSVCSAIDSLPSSSTMSIWKNNLLPPDDKANSKSIYWASKHYRDYFQVYMDFTARLSYYMTPQRLQSTIKSIPRNQQMDKVGKILDIAYKRYEYLQQKESGKVFPKDYKEPRKVHVLVMGGSVALGMMCSNLNPVAPTANVHREHCAWPNRLYSFIDHFFPGVLEGHILTVGGINTLLGTEVWKYNMVPADSKIPQEPDILINAYSTNDMHVNTVNESTKQNITMEEMVHTMYEEFIREVLRPRSSCEEREPPLLLFLDDYIGNEQRKIRETLTVNSIGHRLSTYYGFGFMSYADAVRDLVYGDTNEWWFSPKEWPARQIHPGMGAHISMMWTVAYNFLNMATSYCDRLEIGPEHIYDSNIYGMAELKSNKTLDGEPKPKVTNALPPRMTADLSLDDVTIEWRKAEKDLTALAFNASQCTASTVTNKPCTFSWAWNILDVLNQSILNIMEPHVTLNDGWEELGQGGKVSEDRTKRGLVPNKSDAKLKMKFNLTESVEMLNFIVMQSYGEKWANSEIEVKAIVLREGVLATEKTMQIKGFHAKHTSESYNYKMDLGENKAVTGDELIIDIKLVGGTTFKIMGMMFCRF